VEISLPVVTSKQRGPVYKEVLEVAQADYQFMLRAIAAQEIQAQIKIGNPPTNIIVDGRARKPINTATKSVVAYFNDAATVLEALKATWIVLQAMARRVTGHTVSQFEIWIGERRVATDPSGVSLAMLQKGRPVRIVGPMVAHSRKYRWLFQGRAPKTKKPTDLHNAVIRRMKSKYRSLSFYDYWVNTRELNVTGFTSVNRIPTISISMKRKGRI
jgi:hypothetical protein